MSFVGGGTTVECEVTITKTISRSWPKTSGILIGKITRIAHPVPGGGGGHCRSSTGRLLEIEFLGLEREEEWRIFYISFGGTLPRINKVVFEIKRIRAAFRVEVLGIRATCLNEQEEGGRGLRGEATVNETTGVIGNLIINENTSNRTPRSGVRKEANSAARSYHYKPQPLDYSRTNTVIIRATTGTAVARLPRQGHRHASPASPTTAKPDTSRRSPPRACASAAPPCASRTASHPS